MISICTLGDQEKKNTTKVSMIVYVKKENRRKEREKEKKAAPRLHHTVCGVHGKGTL